MSLQVSSEYLLDKCFGLSKNLEKNFNYVTTKNVDESLYFFSNNQLRKIDFSTGFVGYSLPFFFKSYDVYRNTLSFFFEESNFLTSYQKIRGINEYYNYNNTGLTIDLYSFSFTSFFVLSFQNKQFIYTKYCNFFGLFDCATNTFSCSSLNSELFHFIYICNDEDRVLSFGSSSVESLNLLDNSRFILNYSLKLHESFYRTVFHSFLKDKLFFGDNTYSHVYMHAYPNLGFSRKVSFYLGSTKDYALIFKFSVYVGEIRGYTTALYSYKTISKVYSSKGSSVFSCGTLSDTWKTINETLDKIRDFTPSISDGSNNSSGGSDSSFTTSSRLFGSILDNLFPTRQTSSTNQVSYRQDQSNIIPQYFTGSVTYSVYHEASKLSSFIGVPLYERSSNNFFNNVVPEQYWVYRDLYFNVSSFFEQSIPYKISYSTGTVSNLSNTLDFMSVKKATYNKLPGGQYRFCSLLFSIYPFDNAYSYNYRGINFFISSDLDLCAYDSSLNLEFVVSKDIYVYGLKDYIEFYPGNVHDVSILWDLWNSCEKKAFIQNSNRFFNIYGSKNFGFCFISGEVFYGRGSVWNSDLIRRKGISLVFAINLDTYTVNVFSNMVGEPDNPLKFR